MHCQIIYAVTSVALNIADYITRDRTMREGFPYFLFPQYWDQPKFVFSYVKRSSVALANKCLWNGLAQ